MTDYSEALKRRDEQEAEARAKAEQVLLSGRALEAKGNAALLGFTPTPEPTEEPTEEEN